MHDTAQLPASVLNDYNHPTRGHRRDDRESHRNPLPEWRISLSAELAVHMSSGWAELSAQHVRQRSQMAAPARSCCVSSQIPSELASAATSLQEAAATSGNTATNVAGRSLAGDSEVAWSKPLGRPKRTVGEKNQSKEPSHHHGRTASSSVGVGMQRGFVDVGMSSQMMHCAP